MLRDEPPVQAMASVDGEPLRVEFELPAHQAAGCKPSPLRIVKRRRNDASKENRRPLPSGTDASLSPSSSPSLPPSPSPPARPPPDRRFPLKVGRRRGRPAALASTPWREGSSG